MRALLDTHALLFWAGDPGRLSPRSRAVLEDRANVLLWSAASTWELAIKAATGKLRLGGTVADLLPGLLARHAITSLPVRDEHAWRVEALPRHHGDPFDRLLIAQALVEAVPLVTADSWAAAYGVEVVW